MQTTKKMAHISNMVHFHLQSSYLRLYWCHASQISKEFDICYWNKQWSKTSNQSRGTQICGKNFIFSPRILLQLVLGNNQPTSKYRRPESVIRTLFFACGLFHSLILILTCRLSHHFRDSLTVLCISGSLSIRITKNKSKQRRGQQ